MNDNITWIEIDASANEQRIDNFLIKQLKKVPKSYIYRIVRTGQVRINGKRIKPDYRLQIGDKLRLPPIKQTIEEIVVPDILQQRLLKTILFEDSDLIILNKLSGLPVHGGSDQPFGIIEIMRQARPDILDLELAHRLDQETSGCLILTKNRNALLDIQRQIQQNSIAKRYLCLVKGIWRFKQKKVVLPLRKNILASGERMVVVDPQGKIAKTIFSVKQLLNNTTLMQADIVTGRTHQIRVHAQAQGFPIAGDKKYGDKMLNRDLYAKGLKRTFLHAWHISLIHPTTKKTLVITANLPEELSYILDKIK